MALQAGRAACVVGWLMLCPKAEQRIDVNSVAGLATLLLLVFDDSRRKDRRDG